MTDSNGLEGRKQLGLLFQQAREAKNLAVIDVSAELKLLGSSVRGLESADYSAIKGSVFVKGYIKAYAQFLQLDQDECLRLYAEGDVPASEVIPVSHEDKALPPYSLIKIAVGLAILVVILFCYQQCSATAKSESVVPVLPGAPNDGSHELTDIPAALQTEVPAVAQQRNVESLKQVPDEGAAVANAEDILNAGDLKLVDPIKTLDLTFNDDCWVEITDASGKRLISDLKRAGEELVLNGEPPFEALFGYGPAVAISYLGQPINFTVGENPTVKLTIGEKQ